MQRSWVGVVIFGCACGPVVPSIGEDTGGESTASGLADAGAGDGSNDSALDDSSTGVAEVHLCGAPDASVPLAVLGDARGGTVLRADGSTSALELSPSTAPAGADTAPGFAPRGEWIAVVRTWFEHVGSYGTQIDMLTQDGQQRWTVTHDLTSLSSLHVGDDGTIVASRSDATGATTGVLYLEAGEQVLLPGLTPVGRRRSDGWIPGWLPGANGDSTAGWMSSELAVRQLRHPVLWSWVPRDDGAFVYLTADAGTVSLVVDEPDAATIVTIDALAGVDTSTLSVSASPDARWLLVHDDTLGWWRIAVGDGATDALDLTPPQGTTMMECYSPPVAIDDAGRLLVATRDATAAAALRLDPVADTWEVLGERVTDVDGIATQPFGETLLVQTSGQGTTFCPRQEFDPGSAVLGGATQQLLRPIDGYARVVADDVALLPDRQGRCAALTSAEGLTLVDVVQDLEIDPLPGATALVWWNR